MKMVALLAWPSVVPGTGAGAEAEVEVEARSGTEPSLLICLPVEGAAVPDSNSSFCAGAKSVAELWLLLGLGGAGAFRLVLAVALALTVGPPGSSVPGRSEAAKLRKLARLLGWRGFVLAVGRASLGSVACAFSCPVETLAAVGTGSRLQARGGFGV